MAADGPVELVCLPGQALIDPAELCRVLPPGGLTLVSSCSAESALLADSVVGCGDALGRMTFTGVFLPGVTRRTWLPGRASRVVTFFMTPELSAAGERVDFLPLCYEDALAWFRSHPPTAVLLTCGPPDSEGFCSFGTEVSFVAELWRAAPIRIAHINPSMPRTGGDRGIPFDALTAFVEYDQPLLTIPGAALDAVSAAIAANIAPYIGDGATVQVGLGKIPDAVSRSLTHLRNLRIHGGMVGDGVLDLLAAGALADGASVVTGMAIGSQALYDAVAGDPFAFRPVSVSHGHDALAAIDRLVTINSALQVDLYGQAYAERMPAGWMSGPGGATDFARGARHGNGLRIVALPATANDGAISRLVPPGGGLGPVSMGRTDIDIVVTEFGAADLRGKTHTARADALIAIAAPGTFSAAENGAYFDRSVNSDK